jgi:hypothetical protein
MKGRPEGQVFLLFDHPYRWEGQRLIRVPDDEARCQARFDRTPFLLQCEKLALHDGKHSA